MRRITVAATALGLLALAGSASAETPLLEEFMRKYGLEEEDEKEGDQ